MLEAVKLALRINTGTFDNELTALIQAALKDMGIIGITVDDTADPLIVRAVTTYCKMNFGEPASYDRLKASYDEQKAQMQMSSVYYGEGC